MPSPTLVSTDIPTRRVSAHVVESCVRLVTPTVRVTVPHPPPVIRDAQTAGPTVRTPRSRSPRRWGTLLVCLGSFAIGVFAGHLVKSDLVKSDLLRRAPAASTIVRAARAPEVVSARVDGARPRAPIPPVQPPARTASRKPTRMSAASSPVSDLELAFRAELHP